MLQNGRTKNFRLNENGILESLQSEEYEILMASGVTHSYKKGEIIFREGGIATGIFHLKSGRVKKYKLTPKGGEQLLYLCVSGDFLGYHALLSETGYPDFAATIEESQITFIPKEVFLNVLQQSPVLSNYLLRSLAGEFSVYINNITNTVTKTVRERLAITLLLLEEKFKSTSARKTSGEIVMSRGDLANMVGTAKETLVRLLQELSRAGIIEKTDRSVRILNRKKLLDIAR